MTDEQKARDLSVYGVAIEKDGKRISPEDFYDKRSDEQALWQEMGMCWHEVFWFESAGAWECKNCERRFYYEDAFANPDFTSGDILWRVLTYMMGREDWDRFFCFATDEMEEIVMEDAPGYPDGTIVEAAEIKLLFTAPPDGNVRLVGLAARWCREKE